MTSKINFRFCMTLALLFLASLKTNAIQALGRETGNGGNAVVCYTNANRKTIKSVKMFDYWEQQQVLNYGSIDLGDVNLSVPEKINIASARVAKFDPNLASFILKTAMNLNTNIKQYLVTNEQLPEIDDANPIVIPNEPNCFIEQYGIQYKDVVTGQRRFSISDKIYNHSSTTNDAKVGLLLHEAIYRFAIVNNNASNSDGVRFFNYLSATKKLETLDFQNIDAYVDLLMKSGLDSRDCIKEFGGYFKKSDAATFSKKDKSSCFNQVMNYKDKIKAKLSFGDIINIQDVIKVEFGATPSTELRVQASSKELLNLISINQAPVNFHVDKIYFNETAANSVYIDSPKNQIFQDKIEILGPLNEKFKCTVMAAIDFNTGEVLGCGVDKRFSANSETYHFIRIEKLENGYFNIYDNSDPKFKILGSTKNLKINATRRFRDSNDPYNPLHPHRCEMDLIVDQQMNLVQGCASNYKTSSIAINNQLELIESFKVDTTNGKYTLNVVSPFEKNNPKIQNLRVIYSNPDENRLNNMQAICSYFGREGWPDRYTMKKEYVDFHSESFFDLNSKKIIVKTDEDVDVLTDFECDKATLKTEDY